MLLVSLVSKKKSEVNAEGNGNKERKEEKNERRK
jgi:hypothetical protein